MIIRGRVQGVGFRYFVRVEARALDLLGRVRNLSDGAVEVEAEGSEPALQKLLAIARTGPRNARVTEVHEEWSEGPPRFGAFEITG